MGYKNNNFQDYVDFYNYSFLTLNIFFLGFAVIRVKNKVIQTYTKNINFFILIIYSFFSLNLFHYNNLIKFISL